MNPWTALLKPIRSRPGDVERPKRPVRRPVDRFKAKPAAALVLTETRFKDRPYVRLLPIIVVDFYA